MSKKVVTVEQLLENARQSAALTMQVAEAAAASIEKQNEEIKEVKKSVSDGKSAIASAITDKGVSTSQTADFSTMADNIRAIRTGIELSSISIANPPAKTTYRPGETFNPAGMSVLATYSNGATRTVTGYTCVPLTPLTSEDTSVNIQYVEQGVTKTVEQAVLVQNEQIAMPSLNGALTYNGSVLTPQWNNYVSSKMAIGGDASGTNAGSYTAKFTPLLGYCWPDGTTGEKIVTWSIGQAAGSLTLSKELVTLNDSNLTDTVIVTRPGDGVITAISSDTSVATASVSGEIVTISHVSQTTGTATITIKVAAGTNHTAPADKTVAVTAQFVDPVLNNNSWAVISDVSAKGQGANYWNVGDRKAVVLNGTVGILTLNTTLYVYILGFNHNAAKEGNGIHFGTFETALSGGTNVCLVDSQYDKNSNSGDKYFNMNHWGGSSSPWNTNYGGWKGCDLRYDVLGSTKTAPSGYGSMPTTSRVGYDAPADTATSPVANTLMAALPSDLRAVMRPITKYTDNNGNSSDVAANVTASVDYLPLLAEAEIFGKRTNANQFEKDYQQQYAYYSAGNSKVKYRHDNTGTAVCWWERSPHYPSGHSFCYVYSAGGARFNGSRYSHGLAPVFMV